MHAEYVIWSLFVTWKYEERILPCAVPFCFSMLVWMGSQEEYGDSFLLLSLSSKIRPHLHTAQSSADVHESHGRTMRFKQDQQSESYSCWIDRAYSSNMGSERWRGQIVVQFFSHKQSRALNLHFRSQTYSSSRWLTRKIHLPYNSHFHVRVRQYEFNHYKIRPESTTQSPLHCSQTQKQKWKPHV